MQISPSIMCADLCNLQRDIEMMEQLGIQMLHIDFVDSHFSPSLPLGIDLVRQLRKITKMKFDVHLMVQNNEFFINELLELGVHQMCFHCESAVHADRLLHLMKQHDVKAGIALNPATALANLQYVIDLCDYILLMLINPGFAGHKGEAQVPYAEKKIADCRRLIRSGKKDIPIEVDGRVSLDRISSLVAAGADILVAGSTSLFFKGHSMRQNLSFMEASILEGIKKRMSV